MTNDIGSIGVQLHAADRGEQQRVGCGERARPVPRRGPDEVEAVLAEVEAAQHTSSLPDEPDLAAAEALVVRAHRAQVLGRGGA